MCAQLHIHPLDQHNWSRDVSTKEAIRREMDVKTIPGRKCANTASFEDD